MRVIHEWGRFLSIEENGVERLRYQYQMEGDPLPSAPKPFIHPIRTPAGLEMTAAKVSTLRVEIADVFRRHEKEFFETLLALADHHTLAAKPSLQRAQYCSRSLLV